MTVIKHNIFLPKSLAQFLSSRISQIAAVCQGVIGMTFLGAKLLFSASFLVFTLTGVTLSSNFIFLLLKFC